MPVKNAYIHIPFCKSKCNYCSFISFNKLELKEKYLLALKKQIESEYKQEKLNTLYFGGGTPSLLSIDEINSLISLFKLEDYAEVTIEVNPDSVDSSFLMRLRELGINRISIGTQTFNEHLLKLIGRRHNSEQIFNAVNWAVDAGFENISLDFIYGLPTQSIEDFEADLKKTVELPIQHISLYGLKIEEGCHFYKHKPKKLPNLDIQADMYLKAIEILTQAGFEHYEVSNFSKTGFNSRHNKNYWDNNSYYGFGCAASGYVDSLRYQMEPDLEKYILNPLKKDFEQKLTKDEILEEEIFLGLRRTKGLNIDEINQKFGIDFNKKYVKILDKYSQYFIKTDNTLAFNNDGILISNIILSEFIGC